MPFAVITVLAPPAASNLVQLLQFPFTSLAEFLLSLLRQLQFKSFRNYSNNLHSHNFVCA